MGRGQNPLKAAGFNTYPQYLASPQWRTRRNLALRRDDYRCACGKRAVQVHHRTYARVGNEPLTDLHSVCDDCHRRIHQRRDERRETPAQATDAILGLAPKKKAKQPRSKAKNAARNRRRQKRKRWKEDTLAASMAAMKARNAKK